MLGKKIRDTRKNKRMTLKNLADEAGLTSSYISQVEREIVDPSISSLRKISAALNVPMFSFLDDTEKEVSVIRSEKRKKLILPESNVIYEFLTPTNSSENEKVSLEIIELRVESKCWTREDYSVHSSAEECIIVVSGKLIIDFGEEQHELNEGDSIYIHRNKPHKAYNPLDKETRALLCVTPPLY